MCANKIVPSRPPAAHGFQIWHNAIGTCTLMFAEWNVWMYVSKDEGSGGDVSSSFLSLHQVHLPPPYTPTYKQRWWQIYVHQYLTEIREFHSLTTLEVSISRSLLDIKRVKCPEHYLARSGLFPKASDTLRTEGPICICDIPFEAGFDAGEPVHRTCWYTRSAFKELWCPSKI